MHSLLKLVYENGFLNCSTVSEKSYWVGFLKLKSRKKFGWFRLPIVCEFPQLLIELYGLSVGRNSIVGTGWTVEGSNPRRSEIFRTRSERPWGPTSLLYSGYQVFPSGEVTGAWSWPPTPSSAKDKEKVEPYFHSSSVPSWPVPGWTSPLLLL
jgi:hypothetical protein